MPDREVLRKPTVISGAALTGLILVIVLFDLPLSFTGLGETENAFAQENEATSPDELQGSAEKPFASEPKELDKESFRMEILKDVGKRANELDTREKELDQREERLNALSGDIEKQLDELKSLQAKIDDNIKLRNDLEEKAIGKLAKTYASMPPGTAAGLIAQMDIRIVIRMMSVMKERSAGKILAVTEAKLASKISEGLVKKK